MTDEGREAEAAVEVARGPDGALARWRVTLRDDGTLLVSRAEGPLAEPRIVACVDASEARIEDGLWESRLHAADVSLPLRAGERAAVARLLALRGAPAASDRDLEWRRRHLDALRKGRVPRARVGAPVATRRLAPKHWRLLVPPDRHRILDHLAEQIWPPLFAHCVMTDRDAGLNRRYQLDPATSSVPIARTFGDAARALGLPCPRLFVRADVQGGFAYLRVWPLATVSGNSALDLTERELLFLWGSHVAAYRPESYLSTLFPSPRQLADAVHAALRIADAVGPAEDGVEQLAQQLAQHMMPAQLDAISKICGLLSIELPPAELRDVLHAASERWLFAVVKTRARAGLLVCDELATALDLLAQLGPPWDGEPLREDLERFWTSEELSTLRRALGR